jgi:hypothetical protein
MPGGTLDDVYEVVLAGVQHVRQASRPAWSCLAEGGYNIMSAFMDKLAVGNFMSLPNIKVPLAYLPVAAAGKARSYRCARHRWRGAQMRRGQGAQLPRVPPCKHDGGPRGTPRRRPHRALASSQRPRLPPRLPSACSRGIVTAAVRHAELAAAELQASVYLRANSAELLVD